MKICLDFGARLGVCSCQCPPPQHPTTALTRLKQGCGDQLDDAAIFLCLQVLSSVAGAQHSGVQMLVFVIGEGGRQERCLLNGNRVIVGIKMFNFGLVLGFSKASLSTRKRRSEFEME